MNHYYRLFASVAFMCAFAISGNAQTTVPSFISGNNTWDISGNPYLVQSNVLVEKGAKLTIGPGVIVKGRDSYRIIVDGELVAKGKKDSIITLDTITFEFTSQSVGYDFSTATGSNFSYCLFNGNGFGGMKTIDLNQVSMLVSNCKFYNTYYTVYGVNANTDTAKVRIEKSVFDGGNGYTYVMMPNGRYTFIEIDECNFKSISGMYLANYTSITRSSFTDWKSYGGLRINSGSTSYPSEVYISCNSFLRFQNSIIEMMGISATQKVTITNNSFDSSNYLIDCYLLSNSNKTNKLLVENNNFLRFNKKSIYMHGGSNPGKADTINFRSNYWGTTSATDIETGIFDFKDDITVVAKVDFSSYHSAKQSQCSTQNPGGTNATRNITKTEFTMMPNPAAGMVKIYTPSNGEKTIRICDLSGKVIMTQNSQANEFSIDCSNLSNGMYVVEVAGDGQKCNSQKLLVSK